MEVTLIQYATVAGHFAGVTASSVKPKPKKASKAEETLEESPKEETQANATTPITPKPKAKGQARGTSQTSPAKVQAKPPEAKKGGKGGGKGKRGNSESKPEKRKQQCIPFFRGTCQKGDQCKYQHQVAIKAKAAPRGGVTASMIILDPEVEKADEIACAARTPASDKKYAMVDSGTNAIIVPLHPGMKGKIAECQVPSATVTGPIVQVYEHRGTKRLVVACV